jgi:hypothetical protein
MTAHEDDPTAWLGDPVGMHATAAGDVVISVPPAKRDEVVISLTDAPLIDDRGARVDAFVALRLESARGVLESLQLAVSQLEEHAG